MRMVMFLVLLGAGILTFVGALFLTRQTWRPDIEPFGRRHRPFQIALHPEHYATGRHLRLIRALNLVGGLLLCGALAVVAYDIILTTASH
jgi:hypothetical protein